MFDDVDDICARQVEYVRNHPLIPKTVQGSGWIWEVETGHLRPHHGRVYDKVNTSWEMGAKEPQPADFSPGSFRSLRPLRELGMPTYEYVCSECQHRFEAFHGLSDPFPACPACGAGATRLPSRVAVHGRMARGREAAMHSLTPSSEGAAHGCAHGHAVEGVSHRH
jgi:putative FmdB family regulatory protein